MTITTTKKKTTTKATPLPKLDRNCFQFEILELASKQRSNAKKVEVLKEYRNDALISIVMWNFDENIKFLEFLSMHISVHKSHLLQWEPCFFGNQIASFSHKSQKTLL